MYGSVVKNAQLHEITTQYMDVLSNISFVCAIFLGELGLILKLPRNNLAVTAKDHNSVTRVAAKIILNTNRNIINFGNIEFIKFAIGYKYIRIQVKD